MNESVFVCVLQISSLCQGHLDFQRKSAMFQWKLTRFIHLSLKTLVLWEKSKVRRLNVFSPYVVKNLNDPQQTQHTQILLKRYLRQCLGLAMKESHRFATCHKPRKGFLFSKKILDSPSQIWDLFWHWMQKSFVQANQVNVFPKLPLLLALTDCRWMMTKKKIHLFLCAALTHGESLTRHQPVPKQSGHDSSLPILVFYTWIGVVTVMIIGAFIALKQRHRVSTFTNSTSVLCAHRLCFVLLSGLWTFPQITLGDQKTDPKTWIFREVVFAFFLVWKHQVSSWGKHFCQRVQNPLGWSQQISNFVLTDF